MIARGFEFPAARQQSVIYFRRPLDGGTVNGRGNPVDFRVRGIEQDYAPLGKQPREQTREGAAEIFSRAVGLTQEIRDFGITQESRGRFKQWFDFGAKRDRPYRRIGQSSGGGREFLQGAIWP